MILVIYPQDGWILERMALELLQRIPGTRGVDFRTPGLFEPGGVLDTGDQKVNYFINYAVMARTTAKFDSAWFTHPEPDGQFHQTARAVDLAICNCDIYRDELRALGVAAETVLPGVDQSFTPKLRLGFVGRLGDYARRKGGDLLEKVAALPFVELHATGGGLNTQDLPRFYNGLDYVLVTSRYEGGPMCLLEGIACGKKIICPPDVGLAPRFPDHVVGYEKGNWASLEDLLRALHAERLKIARQVADCTWDNWALEHLRLFKRFAFTPRRRS